MKLCSGFEKALIPVLAGILTASGNPTSALSYQGAAFAAAQTVEAFSESFALPLVYASGVLGATGAFLPTLRLSAVSEMIRKISTTVFGSAATLFSGFLALKNIISGSADSLAAKGIRLAANIIKYGVCFSPLLAEPCFADSSEVISSFPCLLTISIS